MAVWNGVPLQKAVLVRHEERGALASGGPKGVSDALDYIGREGRYESKSGIDRGATAADSRLVDGMSEEARRALDYIGREGDFAHKGEGRQVDATYWGQDGPMSREEAARGMTGAGAYMQSIVTVDRRYASELGYTSKQDFQRLIRSTWAEQARAWTKLDRPTERMFEHPEDIRWVASYHTDADQSLHVHVYTWGRAGDMRPGDRVSKTSTREGKEIVYREAYAKVRAARNERHTYLRDISRLNMARQLGQDVDQARVDALHAKAEARGWPERVADGPDWDASRHRGVERQIFKLREGLERGHGRLSRNFDAGAVARDLIREIENASPSAKAIKEAIRETDEQKADLYGYGSERQLGRGKMLRREREDYLSRLVPTVEKACLGTKRPEQLELEAGPSDGSGAARNLRSEARRDASAGPSQDDEAQKPGSRGGARKPSAPSAGISASRRAGEPPWEAAKRELKAKGQWVEPEAYKARMLASI